MRKKLARGRAEMLSNKCGLRHDKNLLLLVLVALISGLGLIVSGQATAQNFTTLYTFTGGNDGGNPQAGLILSSNTLYGTASQFGTLSGGTVFKLNADGTGFTTLHSFGSPSDGADPQAGLILSGNTLYGTAFSGGSLGKGTIFRLNTDSSGYTTLYAFGVWNDYYVEAPAAGLALSGSTLFGTSTSGGNAYGTIFEVNTAGTDFFGLHNFNPPIEGAYPFAGLIFSENTLYGTTQQGGYSNNGTVFGFTLSPSGFVFATLHSFAPLSGPNLSTNSDGANPVAGLILSGTTLYGTAEHGGGSGYGTVFKLNTDGTGLTTLHSFSSGNDGANPVAGLILSGSILYGTTFQGGSSGGGTVFALNVNGTGFTNLYNFTGGSDGANPMATLILSGNTLYGSTSYGGSSGNGTVFSLSLGPVNPPHLAIIPDGANVILTWTNTPSAFTLQCTTNLVSPAGWSSNSIAPVVINGLNTVTNPVSDAQQFFRLSL